MTIQFSPPDISDEEINEVIDTLKSGWITTGPKTKLFEKNIASYCGVNKAVCLNSATSCMELVLRLMGVGEGDEVITSAYTYTASASVIQHIGATIVLSDTQKNSLEIDYDNLGKLITEKTKAIIPVDIAGVMCDYAKLYDVIEKNKHKFVESHELQKLLGRPFILADAAHSFGAIQKGKKSGSVADFTSFSFHAVKNLTTAEGGAITWRNDIGLNDENIYKQFMLMSLHGQNKDAFEKTKVGSWEYDVIEPYYKCNMTDISASLGLVQLKRYDGMLNKRHTMIEEYNNFFEKYNVEVLPHKTMNGKSSGHLYFIRLTDKDMEFRNYFIEEMAKQGVTCNVHYKPLPLLSAYSKLGFDIADFPNAYEMYQNEVTLPLHTCLTEEELKYILSCVENVLK